MSAGEAGIPGVNPSEGSGCDAGSVTVRWLCTPWPFHFACENENSNVRVVKSVIDPEKLTGMTCSDNESLPGPPSDRVVAGRARRRDGERAVIGAGQCLLGPPRVGCCGREKRRGQQERKREKRRMLFPLPRVCENAQLLTPSARSSHAPHSNIAAASPGRALAALAALRSRPSRRIRR
jgi:hypothetical protein